MKKFLKWIIIVPIVIGIILSIYITVKNQKLLNDEKKKIQNVFWNNSSVTAEISKFYTYGTALNLEGKIAGISKDNYEGIRLIITDGAKVNKEYRLDTSFQDNNLIFSSSGNMNKSINLEELEAGYKYYVKIRLKVNNSKDYKYYLLENKSGNPDIEYYTLTKDNKNNKINMKFEKETYNSKEYSYLGINVVESSLPEEIFDFVIDARSWRNR